MRGVALDLQGEPGWALVAVLRDGALRGIGLATPESTPDGVPGTFAFDVLDDLDSPRWGAGALALVVAQDGAFAELPFEAGLLGGAAAY